MHRPAHYLKNDGLPSPEMWMSTEMLYRIPREPATIGIRSLGRLALLDHYPLLSQKIRQDLEAFLSDDVLLEADRQTNLGIRINRPRVYLASSLCGGTGSGMLIDLAYIVRHEMRQMGFTKPQVTGLLLRRRSIDPPEIARRRQCLHDACRIAAFQPTQHAL